MNEKQREIVDGMREVTRIVKKHGKGSFYDGTCYADIWLRIENFPRGCITVDYVMIEKDGSLSLIGASVFIEKRGKLNFEYHIQWPGMGDGTRKRSDAKLWGFILTDAATRDFKSYLKMWSKQDESH